MWSLRNLGPWKNRPIAAHGTASVVLVRDEAWKVAPKSIALEAGRLAVWRGQPSSAQAYASHLISGWGHTRAGSRWSSCWAVGAMGMVPPSWGRCPGNQLGGTWQLLGEAERQNPTTAFTGKTCLHAGAACRSEARNCAALISILAHSRSHSPTPLTYSTSSSSSAQLSSVQVGLTRPDQTRPVQSSPVQSCTTSSRPLIFTFLFILVRCIAAAVAIPAEL